MKGNENENDCDFECETGQNETNQFSFDYCETEWKFPPTAIYLSSDPSLPSRLVSTSLCIRTCTIRCVRTSTTLQNKTEAIIFQYAHLFLDKCNGQSFHVS